MPKNEGRHWRPTEEQELILTASLLSGEPAVEAWHQWKSKADIDHLDQGSFRLLPLLYRNMSSHEVQDSAMNKLKGVYRLTWYKNQVLLRHMALLLRNYHESGIETMVLKGAALTLLYYKDYGLRPMGDLDILVHTDQALPAINVLERSGWTPREFSPTKEYISTRYSHGFVDGNGRELDLHWHLMPECCSSNADDDFWESALTSSLHGIPVQTLSHTHQLLHTCIHGSKWNAVSPCRWVADAVMLIRHAQSEIDWNDLLAQAAERHVILPLRDTLQYLHDRFHAPIPKSVMKQMRSTPVPEIERIEYTISIKPRTYWTAILELWCTHTRLMENTGMPERLIKFPGFLQRIWGVALWKLPFYGILKVMTWHKNPLSEKYSQK